MECECVLHLVNGHRMLGAERVAAEICQGLSGRVRTIIGLVNGSQDMKDELISSYGCNHFTIEIFSGCSLFEAVRKIAAFCCANKVTIIHSHGYKSNFLTYAIVLRYPSIKIVSTNHNYIVSTFKERIYRWLDLRILSRFGAVVAVSQQVRDDMYRHGFKGRSDVQIVFNGIDFSQNAECAIGPIRKEIGVPEESFIVGIVASLTEEKAHGILLNCFKEISLKHHSVYLVIVGDGVLREKLVELSLELGLADKVRFLGHRTDIAQLLSSFDVFVLPSLREGLPMAMLEAMSVGLPVVVSAVGAIPQVIDNGKNGFLVKPGDARALASKLDNLLVSPMKLKSIGAAAQETVQNRFSRTQMVDSYCQIYLHVLGGE